MLIIVFFLAPDNMSQLRFRSVSHLCGPVGHTHGPLDQRFSVVTTGLAQAKVLEHPEDFVLQHKLASAYVFFWSLSHVTRQQDFVQVIKQTVRPSRGRELVVDVLMGAWDFKMYYHGLDLHIAGLVSGPRHVQTIHSWRIVRRAAPQLIS